MIKDDIIRMAKEADLWGEIYAMQRFAELVAAANDNKYPIKFTHEEYNAVIEAAIADEREACAKVCDKKMENHGWDEYIDDIADEIRARGDALTKLNQAAEDNGEEL